MSPEPAWWARPARDRLSHWQASRGQPSPRGSALADLEARDGLVDDEHAPLAPHQAAVLVAALRGAQRVLDLHDAASAGFLRRKLEKRRLNLSTWPPRSTRRERSPVHAGCTLGSISRVIVAPASPKVERVVKVDPSVMTTVISW